MSVRYAGIHRRHVNILVCDMCKEPMEELKDTCSTDKYPQFSLTARDGDFEENSYSHDICSWKCLKEYAEKQKLWI